VAKYFRGAKVSSASERYDVVRQIQIDEEPKLDTINCVAAGIALAHRNKPWARRWLREHNVRS